MGASDAREQLQPSEGKLEWTQAGQIQFFGGGGGGWRPTPFRQGPRPGGAAVNAPSARLMFYSLLSHLASLLRSTDLSYYEVIHRMQQFYLQLMHSWAGVVLYPCGIFSSAVPRFVS